MAKNVVDIKITDNMDEVLEAKNGIVDKILEEWGLIAERYAKEKCPVDTGRLRNSITHAKDEKTMYVGTNVEYAPYVEMGTTKQKAQSYLRPSIEDHVTEYKQIADKELKSS